MESDAKHSKPLVKFADRVIDVIVPRMRDILAQEVVQGEGIENAYEVLQSAENELRSLKKSNMILRERTNELQNQMDLYR